MLTDMYQIAHIENNFTEKFAVPRQSGLADEVRSRIVFEPDFRVPEAFRGLEDFSHIWLIWEFDKAVRRGSEKSDGQNATGVCDWRPTVRPPRLGGNKDLECSPQDPHLGPTLSVCPAWSLREWITRQQTDLCLLLRERTL